MGKIQAGVALALFPSGWGNLGWGAWPDALVAVCKDLAPDGNGGGGFGLEFLPPPGSERPRRADLLV